MYKRDLVTAEIQRLAEVLAKLLGFKTEGKLDEYELLFEQTLEEKFGLKASQLADAAEFSKAIKEQGLPASKIDMLVKFLFSRLEEGGSFEANALIASRLQYLFEILEFEHHQFNLENMEKQRTIQQYL